MDKLPVKAKLEILNHLKLDLADAPESTPEEWLVRESVGWRHDSLHSAARSEGDQILPWNALGNLIEHGWAVVDDWLPADLFVSLREALGTTGEELLRASMMSVDRRWHHDEIRGDRIRWLKRSDSTLPQSVKLYMKNVALLWSTLRSQVLEPEKWTMNEEVRCNDCELCNERD